MCLFIFFYFSLTFESLCLHCEVRCEIHKLTSFKTRAGPSAVRKIKSHSVDILANVNSKRQKCSTYLRVWKIHARNYLLLYSKLKCLVTIQSVGREREGGHVCQAKEVDPDIRDRGTGLRRHTDAGGGDVSLRPERGRRGLAADRQ